MNSPDNPFALVAAAYRQHRPDYPAALFDYLAELAPRPQAVWDCGCGSGQASLALAKRFQQVYATDYSPEPIAHAPSHPHLHYSVAPAEASGLAADSVDLVFVAQAAHWFDLAAFYAEAVRVGRDDALIAVLGYGVCRINPAVDELLEHFYQEVVGPYWPPERHHIDTEYRELAFPFPLLPTPSMEIQREWQLDHLLGYLSTWSAVTRYRQATGHDPLLELVAPLRAAWGEDSRRVRWPIFLRIGRLADWEQDGAS